MILDSKYNVNGLISFGRDLFLKIFRLVMESSKSLVSKVENEKIRNMIGICSQSYFWKDHRFFRKIRTILFKNPKKCYTQSGLYFFFVEVWRSLFFNRNIQGIIKCEMRIFYNHNSYSCCCLGVIEKSGSSMQPDFYIGSCSRGCGMLLHGHNGKQDDANIRNGGDIYPIVGAPSRSVVAVEVNTMNRTLYFFKDGERLDVAVNELPFSPVLHVGFSGMNGACEIVSYISLPYPTPSNVNPVFRGWKVG